MGIGFVCKTGLIYPLLKKERKAGKKKRDAAALLFFRIYKPVSGFKIE
jgi:hypothetical protein